MFKASLVKLALLTVISTAFVASGCGSSEDSKDNSSSKAEKSVSQQTELKELSSSTVAELKNLKEVNGIAVDSKQQTVVGWEERRSRKVYVKVAVSDADGKFGEPIEVWSAGIDSAPYGLQVDVSIDAEGGVGVAWFNLSEDGKKEDRYVASVSADGKLTQPQRFEFDFETRWASSAHNITSTDSGQIVAIFLVNPDLQTATEATTSRKDSIVAIKAAKAGEEYAAPEVVHRPKNADLEINPPHTVADSSGRFTVVWVESPGDKVFAATAIGDKKFSKPKLISGSGGPASLAAVTLNAQTDEVVAVWHRFVSDGTGSYQSAVEAVSIEGGTPGSPSTVYKLSEKDDERIAPDLLAAAAGDVTAVGWSNIEGLSEDSKDQVSISQSGSKFSSPFTLGKIGLRPNGLEVVGKDSLVASFSSFPRPEDSLIPKQDLQLVSANGESLQYIKLLESEVDSKTNFSGDLSALPLLAVNSSGELQAVWVDSELNLTLSSYKVQ